MGLAPSGGGGVAGGLGLGSSWSPANAGERGEEGWLLGLAELGAHFPLDYPLVCKAHNYFGWVSSYFFRFPFLCFFS